MKHLCSGVKKGEIDLNIMWNFRARKWYCVLWASIFHLFIQRGGWHRCNHDTSLIWMSDSKWSAHAFSITVQSWSHMFWDQAAACRLTCSLLTVVVVPRIFCCKRHMSAKRCTSTSVMWARCRVPSVKTVLPSVLLQLMPLIAYLFDGRVVAF